MDHWKKHQRLDKASLENCSGALNHDCRAKEQFSEAKEKQATD